MKYLYLNFFLLKKSRYLFFLLLLASNNLTGQNKKNEINNYYHLINNAESAILANDLENAYRYFDSLIINFKNIWARDYFKAAQVAFLLCNEEETYNLLISGAEKGISMLDIVNDPILVDFQYTESGQKFTEEYENKSKLYISSINWPVRLEINRLIEEDQFINSKVNDSFFLIKPYYNYLWKKRIKQNGKKLFFIINNYGYPGEKLIGVQQCWFDEFPCDTIKWIKYIQESGPYIEESSTQIMLIHYARYVTPTEYDLLLKQVLLGNFKPKQFAEFSEFLFRYNKSFYHNYRFQYNEWFRINENIEIIDSNRISIGLETVEDRNKKREFSRNRNLDSKINYIILR